MKQLEYLKIHVLHESPVQCLMIKVKIIILNLTVLFLMFIDINGKNVNTRSKKHSNFIITYNNGLIPLFFFLLWDSNYCRHAN